MDCLYWGREKSPAHVLEQRALQTVFGPMALDKFFWQTRNRFRGGAVLRVTSESEPPEVLAAATGEEGLSPLREAEKRPRIGLCSFEMGGCRY